MYNFFISNYNFTAILLRMLKKPNKFLQHTIFSTHHPVGYSTEIKKIEFIFILVTFSHHFMKF